MDERGKKDFRVELAQAQAWLEATSPDDHARWDRALENADLDHDQPTESRLEHDLVTSWRGRQDDQLPDPVRGRAEMAQAEAWLRAIDPDRYRDWSQAHLLALTQAEHDQDHHHILWLWRDHAGNAGADVHGHSGAEAALRHLRERRVVAAAAWFRQNDPDHYRTGRHAVASRTAQVMRAATTWPWCACGSHDSPRPRPSRRHPRRHARACRD